MNSAIVQPFPTLDQTTEAALVASIERFGVLVPVIKDQYGRILDGHHRSRIAEGLGIEYRVDVHQVADDEEAREIACTLNADRRHLTTEQRRTVVAALREGGHSQRAIAGALGVSKRTVEKDLGSQLATGSQVADRVVGRDHKSYPAKRPTKWSSKQSPEAVSPAPAKQPAYLTSLVGISLGHWLAAFNEGDFPNRLAHNITEAEAANDYEWLDWVRASIISVCEQADRLRRVCADPAYRNECRKGFDPATRTRSEDTPRLGVVRSRRRS